MLVSPARFQVSETRVDKYTKIIHFTFKVGKETKELNSIIILWIVVLLIKKQAFLLVRNVRTKETELHKELATIIIL